MGYRYRYEFEEPDDRGRRTVRAFVGSECVMSGLLSPQTVSVTPPYVGMWAPRDIRTGENLPPWSREQTERGEAAIAQLIAKVSKSYVFVFESFDWSIRHVEEFDTRREAEAFVYGTHEYSDDTFVAFAWPFDVYDLVERIEDESLDAEALMVDVLARVAELGLVTT